jgi:hypothetical protein
MKARRRAVAPRSRSDPVHVLDCPATVVTLDMHALVVGWDQVQRRVYGLVRVRCSGVMIVQMSFL